MRQILSPQAVRLAQKALRHPDRVITRLVLRMRLRRTRIEEDQRRLLKLVSLRYGVDGSRLMREYRRSEFHEWFRERRAALDRFKGLFRSGSTGKFGCEALYLLVRAMRPRVVVDTGVLYGASSAHILAGLAHNGGGKLHSIDIGGDPREPPHDYLVPPDLQARWELIIGDSRRELLPLLQRCGSIDLFHHDSLHTWEHMTWEYQTAVRFLGSAGVLSSDDVQAPLSLPRIFRQNAFPAFCRRRQIPFATFRNLGVAFPGSRTVAG